MPMPTPQFRRGNVETLPGMPEPQAKPTYAKPQGTPKPNQYAGSCADCDGWIEAGVGTITKIGDKWRPVHINGCPKTEADVAVESYSGVTAAQTIVDGEILYDGTYTIEFADGSRRTFRLRTQSIEDDFKPGKQIISVLTGADNERDYTRFGQVEPNGVLKVWMKHADAAYAAAAKTFMDAPRAENVTPAINCYRCGHVLTVPASVNNGLGPECAKRGWM